VFSAPRGSYDPEALAAHSSTPLRRRSRTGLLGVAAAVVALAAAPGAGAQTLPTLELLPPADPPVVLGSFRGRVTLDVPVFLAATGADLEIHVVRADYDTPPQAWLMDATTGLPVQALPLANLKGWRGLRRFFHVTIATPAGKPVLDLYRPLCPNSYSRTRIDDSGPLVPRFPTTCRSFSPFTRGMVWGVDAGWAVSAFAPDEYAGYGAERVTLAPGSYRMTIEVAPFFEAFFAIAPEDGEVSFDLLVVKADFYRGRAPAEGRLAPAAAAVPPDDPAPDADTVPDLSALPAWSASLRTSRAREYLSFASTAWNAGPAPLVVEGFRRPGTSTMDAYQYFYDSHGQVVGRTAVGTFDYDTRTGHHHWHFLQFARYAIVDAKTNEVVRSHKQSFCLAPTDAIDLTVPRATLSPYAENLTSVCGDRQARWIREALPAGWGDTYFQAVAGQSFDVTSLPNGRYRMRVVLNPLGLLHEATTANNVEDRYFTLKGKRGHRRIVVDPWHGIER
jgi:hypothetical protein